MYSRAGLCALRLPDQEHGHAGQTLFSLPACPPPPALQRKMKEMLLAAGFRTAEVLPEFQHPLNR